MLLLTKYTVLYKENEICCIILLSLPSRERGLKFSYFVWSYTTIFVAPFAGAWIEIVCITSTDYPGEVAPFAGAWIEIYPPASRKCKLITSLPSRERGLK